MERVEEPRRSAVRALSAFADITPWIACGDGLPLAAHCNVFVKVTKEFTFDEPRHRVVLGRGRAGRIIRDFPGPFLRTGPDWLSRSKRGPPLDYWESGYGGAGRKPS